MQILDNSTIAAVSTPPGKGGVAVIRISGPASFDVADRMFRPAGGRKASSSSPRFATFGKILDSEDLECDTGILTLFKAPASYTGENTAEISCHGGTGVTREVLKSAIAHGAVMAAPGEFTRRAFVNGKLSLTEAEAVGLLIDADTREKVLLSGNAARGSISRAVGAVYSDLLDVMTALYAAIDYPEEGVGDEGERKIKKVIEENLGKIDGLLGTYSLGKAISDGVKTVICGKPNVGKSSLFNMLSGENAAIVTDIAGTTRDVLRETLSFGGVTLLLSDTAGLRDSGDVVEAIGIRRANEELERAELIIPVFDGSSHLDVEDRALLEKLGKVKGKAVSVINKMDLGVVLDEDEIGEIEAVSLRTVTLSCSEDGGSPSLAELDLAVRELYGSGGIDIRNDAVLWDVRQYSILTSAGKALSGALEALEGGAPVDCVCTLTEEAMSYLGETDGKSVGEEIVNEIFSRFCVGK